MSSETETEDAHRRARPTGLQLVVMAESGSRSVALPDSGSVTIGRGDNAEVRVEDASISRAHATIHLGATLQLEDLDSSNGTFLHGERLAARRRVDIVAGEFFEVGSVVCVIRGAAAHERPRQLRTHDYFEVRLQDEVSRAKRVASHPVVIRVRLDDEDDDTAGALVAVVEPGDVAARYAVGEYEILLPEGNPEPLVKALRGALARVGRTATFGIATYPRDGVSGEELFAAACRGLEPEMHDGDGELVIASPAMRKLHELVVRVATAGINVLLLGETGVGKEVFATRLHALSPRASAPLVKLNCAALTPQLFESELFGHERGAFTGADRKKLGLLETAHGGIVFLDEIGELELGLQAKLLRAIEDKRVRRVGGVDDHAIDVSFIGATNRDLDAEVKAGRFRADLYYRLDGFSLEIPPLRERKEEIVPLARGFIVAAAQRMGMPPPPLSNDIVPLLHAHRWTGNIRELRNMMERAVLLSGGGAIRPEHLSLDGLRSATHDTFEASLARASSSAQPPPDLTSEEQAERAQIIETLAAAYGNQTRAAEQLGISRRWLTTKMARYRIPRPRKR